MRFTIVRFRRRIINERFIKTIIIIIVIEKIVFSFSLFALLEMTTGEYFHKKRQIRRRSRKKEKSSLSQNIERPMEGAEKAKLSSG